LEEHMVCQTDVANRAASLNVSAVNVLDGGTYVGARPVRDIAVVRTAGMPGAPVASIPDGTTAAYPLPARVLDFTDSIGVHPFIHTIEVDTADPRVWTAHMGYFSSESVPLPVGI